MSPYSIELTTRDGAKLCFDCAEDINLLEAASNAQISLPSQCRQGSCGACYAEVKKGDYTLGEHNPAALSDDAVKKGGILLCRTLPLTDLNISLPFDQSHILMGQIKQRQAHILQMDIVGSNTLRLELKLILDEEGSNAAEFEAGQFMELEIPEQNIKRAYSLSNISNWEGRLEFLIRIQPGGLFSTWLKEHARIGLPLTVHGPQGTFGLNENSLRPRWFVAGGTGLAPMLSMLRRMAEFQETHPVRLYFGVNQSDELFCRDELSQIQTQLPQLKITLCVWKPDDSWQGFVGTPVDAMRKDLDDTDVLPDIYLCGPPVLIDAAEKVARAKGISDEHIISERFLPS